MKKLFTIIALAGVMTFTAQHDVQAQAAKQLNIGFVGVSYEIPVASAITIAPTAFTNWDFSSLTLGVKGNYYFDDIFGLPSEWDVYGGANLGYGIGIGNNNNSEFAFGFQAGGRWFWSDKWGVYLELGGGNLGGNGGVGVTMKF